MWYTLGADFVTHQKSLAPLCNFWLATEHNDLMKWKCITIWGWSTETLEATSLWYLNKWIGMKDCHSNRRPRKNVPFDHIQPSLSLSLSVSSLFWMQMKPIWRWITKTLEGTRSCSWLNEVNWNEGLLFWQESVGHCLFLSPLIW